MGEYGYMQDGVGLKMVDLDLIVIQHIPKELGGKNVGSVKEKMIKDHYFVSIRHREEIFSWNLLLDDVLLLEDPHCH
jgi:hypothetical protein